MAPLLAAPDSTSKLQLVENQWIEAAPKIDVTWCMPDVYLLQKLKLIAGVPEEIREMMGDYDDDDDGGLPIDLYTRCDQGWSSKEEAEEISSTVSLAASDLNVALWSTVADDLLQNVIARLPLRSLFRAPSLSRQWGLRVRSASFQHELNCSLIASGSSFCPLFVTGNMKVLLGFESSSRRWCRLPTLSYLREEIHFESCILAACGSLFCLANFVEDLVIVTNPITRSWRRLPPFYKGKKQSVQLVCEKGSTTYKVFIHSWFSSDQNYVISIFDSSSSPGPSAVFNGVLHNLVFIYHREERFYASCLGINSFDLKEKVWSGVSCLYQIFPENPQKPPRPLVPRDRFRELLVCESKVILVAKINGDSEGDHGLVQTLSVFELDLDNWWAFELSRAPNELSTCWVEHAVCDGDCIYIGGTFPSMRFNVKTREWTWVHVGESMPECLYEASREYFRSYSGESRPKSCLRSQLYLSRWWRWAPITYQPGLNPLLEP